MGGSAAWTGRFLEWQWPAFLKHMRLGWLLTALWLAWAGAVRAEGVLAVCSEASLRAAVKLGGVIRFECPTNLVTLTEPLIIERDTTLQSTGRVSLTGANATRLIVVNPGIRLTLQNIGIFSGRQTSTNLKVGGVPDTAGAGIFNNRGIVTIMGGQFEAHTVLGLKGADAATSHAPRDGEAGGDAAGAAIFNNTGELVISNAVFSGNSAIGGAGGAGGNSSGGLGGVAGDGGNGGAAGGGAIYSHGGTVSIFNTIFTNNTVTGASAGVGGTSSGYLGFNGQAGFPGDGIGGAVSGRDAQFTLSGCTFVANSAKAADGLDGVAHVKDVNGSPGRPGGIGDGGAIFSAGTLRMTNCTFLLNSATSGKGGAGGAALTAGFGGDGGNGGPGGSARGGAVANESVATVVNCTFSDNRLTAGAGGAGGAGAGLGRNGAAGAAGAALGGSVHNLGTFSLANSILANAQGLNWSGTATDLGGNLSTDTSVPFTLSSTGSNLNPLLLALANYGGPTPTLAIASNSPAIKRAVAALSPPVDQRGTNRFSIFDSGAYQFSLVPLPTNITLQASLGTNGSLTLQWPTTAIGLSLQSSTNLPAATWVSSTEAPGIVGANYLLTVPATNQAVFFRLSTVP